MKDVSTLDQMQRAVELPSLPQRIISLVPSQTELLHDLGLGDRVVGITKFCIHPEKWFRTKPRVGGTKKVDIDKVRALQPDLIIGNKEENAQADIEVLALEFPVWMSDVKDLDDALDMIQQLGELTSTAHLAKDLNDRIQTAFQELRPCPDPLHAAYLIWKDPWMSAGENTFIGDMLKRCGFTMDNTGNGRYPEHGDAQLALLDPDVVLLSSEPYPFKPSHVAEVNMLLPGTPVHLVDGELFSWYGSRLLLAPRYFQELIDRSTP